MTPLPLTCELSSAELQQRKTGLLVTVRGHATRVTPRPDGVDLEFPDSPGILADILELVRLEAACCRFLCFELQTGPASAPIRLRLKGPEGTLEFLTSLGWA